MCNFLDFGEGLGSVLFCVPVSEARVVCIKQQHSVAFCAMSAIISGVVVSVSRPRFCSARRKNSYEHEATPNAVGF